MSVWVRIIWVDGVLPLVEVPNYTGLTGCGNLLPALLIVVDRPRLANIYHCDPAGDMLNNRTVAIANVEEVNYWHAPLTPPPLLFLLTQPIPMVD